MTERKLYLAIDQGGQSTRAIVFDAQGKARGNKQIPVSTRRSNENHIEHDPDELLSSVRDAVDGVVKDALSSGAEIVTAGLATQRSTVVCWDRVTGLALSPVISWQDTRAAPLLQQCAPPEEAVRRITGLARSPHYGASKLRWCLENIPAVAGARDAGTLVMGPLASFLMFHLLTNKPLYADPVNASRTLLWDIATLDWSPQMLTAFAIPLAALPVSVSNQYQFGTLRDSGIPLRVCTGDQNAAIFAGGAVQNGTAYVNIGTGAFVLARTERPPADTRLLRSVTWSDGAHVMRILEGTVNGAGSAAASLNASVTDVETAAAGIAKPGAPLFLNGIAGLGSPYWRENFVSRFVGAGDAGMQLTAVLESVLFLLQVNLNQIAGSTDIRTIVISGGWARNAAVCQGLADLTGITVLRAEEPEATARGVAFLAAGLPDSWITARRQAFVPAEDCNTLRRRFSEWLEEMSVALEL